MNERWDEFDCSIATSLSELPPPEEAVREVTPFRDAVARIVLGLCLTSFTLNLWYLQYLLPAVGAVQIYLGFRALRNNNRWFRAAWFISICKAVSLYISFVLDATPFASLSGAVPNVWAAAFIGMTLALFLCFHFGLTQAAREVEQTPQRRPALWAAVWYAVLVLLGLLAPDIGWLGVIPMIAAFVCIVRSMLRVSEELEGFGYSVRAAPVRCGPGRVSALYLGSLLVMILLCAVWANHLPARGTPVPETVSPETTAIQERLAGLGFPEALLDRLPEEEIRQLSNASRCVVDSSETGAAGSRKGAGAFGFDTVYVETGPRTFRIYEFFHLNGNTLRSNWRALAQLDTDTNANISNVTCGVFWTEDGIPYLSHPEIGSQIHEDFFFGPSTLPSMVFSYPFFSRDRGGYMAYDAQIAEDDWIYLCSVLRTYLTTYRNFYPYADLATDFFQTDWYAQSYSTCEIQPD